MRLSFLFVCISLSLAAQASWFGGNSDNHNNEPAYSAWSPIELKNWLELHGVPLPSHSPSQEELLSLVADNWNKASTWTYDQYLHAQTTFSNLRASSFDTWDESKLRQWLLQQGVVAPKSDREKLVLMAKEKLRAYQDAASTFSAKASATASTMIYGDSTYQMSKSLSSVASQASSAAAQATRDVARSFDEKIDYVYSTWDDNQLRRYLEGRGLLKTNSQKRRDELLAMMHDAYGKVADPIWEAWNDSYMNDWLVSHKIIESNEENSREHLRLKMRKYYYSTSDSVFTSWPESQLRQWLVNHNVIKSEAHVSRDKMFKMLEDNYLSAKDTFWHAWTDNQIREWLVDHGYLRSDAEVKRDHLVKLADEKYHDISAKKNAYLAWPDARLRAYIRERGVSEDMIPGDRLGLLQECRIRWVQTEHKAENALARIRHLIIDGVHKVGDVLAGVVNLLTYGLVDLRDRTTDAQHAAAEQFDAVEKVGWGYSKGAEEKAEKEYYDAKATLDGLKAKAGEGYNDAKGKAEEGTQDARRLAESAGGWVEEKWEEVREKVGGGVKSAGQKIKGEL